MNRYILRKVFFTLATLGFSIEISSQINLFNNSTSPEVFVKNEGNIQLEDGTRQIQSSMDLS